MLPGFDSLHLCLAVGPLAIYFLVIGCMNLRPRMTMLSGFADTLLLGVSVSGFVMVGPVELFFPETAAFKMGPWVWALLIALYALFVLLIALSQRPRMVFFNANLNEVTAIVEQAATRLDQGTRRLQHCLVLPSHELQLYVGRSPLFRTAQLYSLGEEQNVPAWHRLRKQLFALEPGVTSPAPTGYALVTLAGLCLATLVILSVADQHEMARAFGEMLRWD